MSLEKEHGQLVLVKPNGDKVILGTAYKDNKHSIPTHWIWSGEVWMNMRLYELVEKEMVIE